ncbi:MAG: phage tail spike protein [Clostridium sp.]|uniref:phage tail spike protein n=1 Tax=Clostridium sp. TaxID=1506 RepID=UPI0028FDC60D|nr:phage tail spike protein [Clostridium sp.]MDU1279224.1 phage tail spike protein [Clostridium sp.]
MKKQIKVAYFPSYTEKNKVLGSNGKSLDKYCIKCEPDEDLSSGNYILDATFLIEDNLQDLLQEEVILKVLVDYGYEIFRISKVTVGTRYIDVVARQITIADSLTLWLEDVRPTNLNGQAAVSWMLDNAEGRKEIQIVSDIDAIATAYYQRMSLYKALHDNDNSFLNRWGGEVQRRGYTIYINKRIGRDRGFSIREGKNLTGFKGTSNIDNLVTRARGQGYNGILGNYIDSSLIGAYNRIYTSVIKYDDVKVKDEYNDEGYDTLEQAQAELDRRIEEEFSKNDIDKIKASYIINFVQLEKTEEYKNYVVAERLFIGDTSRVYIPKLNVDIKVRAMSKKYDVLAQKTKEIKLSNYIEVKPLSIKQIAEKLELMDSTETILQLAKDNATSLIKGGLKNSYVIVKENEIIIGDTKDINTMTNVWRFNNGGLGHSKTGYYGDFGTAITQDGQIVADFITTGVLNAGLIKTGLLKSFNGVSWINLDDGTFDFANGNLSFDGLNIQLIGKIINILNGYGVEMDQGGIMFATDGEVVGGIRSSRYTDNLAINGLSIVNTRDGDYTDIGFTNSENFEGNTDFYPVLRISKIVNQLLGNFKGIQLLENTRLANMKTFYLESNDSKFPHEIYNTAGGLLALFGDNGVMLGYMSGAEKVKVLELAETVGEGGIQAMFYKNLSMAGNKILGVSDIFTGTTSHRYHHAGWCGSIEATAKRISNLNVYYESGWYAYSSGSQGAPSSYGVMLHLKWGETDFAQIAFDFANNMYQRAWVNGAWTNWTQR